MKIFNTAILLLTLTTACTTKSKYEKAADEILANERASKYMNAGMLKYRVKIPEGWTTDHRTYRGVDYYFLLAPKTIEDPNTNINIITEHMQGLDLPVFKAKAIESIKHAIPSAVILSEGDIKAKGLKGCWFSYTMSPQGIEATLVCYIFPKNGVAYVITAGTQMNDAARYRSIFDSVARSLKFIQLN